MAGMTLEQAQAATKELNNWMKTSKTKNVVKCGWCNGRGKKYASVFGDPALGYALVGDCDHCAGTGYTGEYVQIA